MPKKKIYLSKMWGEKTQKQTYHLKVKEKLRERERERERERWLPLQES